MLLNLCVIRLSSTSGKMPLSDLWFRQIDKLYMTEFEMNVSRGIERLVASNESCLGGVNAATVLRISNRSSAELERTNFLLMTKTLLSNCKML